MRETKTEQRRRAILRGLEFVYQMALDEQNFADYGSDLLNCFYFISSTSADGELRRTARKMGRERARQWRRDYPRLPRKIDAELVADFMHGSYAADHLGQPDRAFKEQIRREAARSKPEEFLWFDPLVEPPPSDIPEECECGAENARGRKSCRRCRSSLTMQSRYWIYLDALTRSYTGERFGVMMGASFESVLKWLPSLRPYDTQAPDEDEEFYEKVYAITHVVYTLNDYSVYTLSPRWLPQEYEYLKAAMKWALDRDDPEMTGEVLDSLRAFGLTSRHQLIRAGMEYLLTTQNEDGSWGDLETENNYQRYHPTWTAIDGLREYAWRGERLSFPRLQPLLEQWAKG